jgi:hypothetical protein
MLNQCSKWLCLLVMLPLPAFAANYQVTYGWTNTTTYLPSDTPDYLAQYRVAGGVPVILSATPIPGGTFAVTAPVAALIEMCVQNRNGTLVNPASCTGNWLTVGNTPPAPLTPPGSPTGFSATIIYTGP